MKLRQKHLGARLCVKHQPQHALICQSRARSLRGVLSSSLSSPKGGEGRGEEAQLSQYKIPSPQPSPRLSGERESDFAPRRVKSHAAAGSATTAALRAFTLVELIAVMALLVTVIAVASPSLAGFFRGRAVDSEARRLMSLTRLGQSRAASEGIPMILWIDLNQRTYGLEAEPSFTDEDTKSVEYTLDGNVTAEIGGTDSVQGAITGNTLFGNGTMTSSKHSSLPHIRFEPDGGVSGSSPENFRLMDRDGGSLWVGLSANRLNYEIRTQETRRVSQRR